MPAYFVIHNRVTDPEAMGQYIPKAVETLVAHGAEFLVMEEDSNVVEGSCEFPRTILVKFETREKAQAWYDCAEYQAVLPTRLGATEGFAVLVNGFEPPA